MKKIELENEIAFNLPVTPELTETEILEMYEEDINL